MIHRPDQVTTASDPEKCPDCGHYDGADPFERPWACPSCGAFFPELNFRAEADS